MDRSHIDILLGATVYSQIIESSVMKGKPNEPIATRSELGWLLPGELAFKGSHYVTHLSLFHTSLDVNSDELSQNFCLQEEGP